MGDRHFKFWPKGVPHELAPLETSVWDSLAVAARRYPSKQAIIYYDSVITYDRLHAETENLAGFLAEDLGIRRGDRVLLYMQNAPQFVIGYYAILRADAVVVPVNPMSRSEELHHMARDSGARVVLCGQELTRFIEPLIADGTLDHAVIATYGDYVTGPTELPLPDEVSARATEIAGPGIVAWRDALAAKRVPGPPQAGPEDWCTIPYSSGTTGLPKGCLHTHRSVMASINAYAHWRTIGISSVTLASLPLFHVTGMQGAMNLPIFVGATVAIMTRWDRATAAMMIERYRVTGWSSITTMAIDFLANPEIGRYDLTSLVSIGGGGAQMPKAVAEKFNKLTGLEYVEGYGLSEVIGGTHINPTERPKLQCAGIPIFGVDSRIVDPDTLEEVEDGTIGEIVISAPQLFAGYWNRPEETAAVHFERDGKRFFRTGDLGYCDEDGYFFLVDRLKRMINAAGFKVWPAEIEAVMHGHPDIREVCVIAAADARRGETVKAVIVPRDAARLPDPEAVQAWCRERVASYKVPRVITFADSLPRSGSGKVLWRVLQDQENAAAEAVAQKEDAT